MFKCSRFIQQLKINKISYLLLLYCKTILHYYGISIKKYKKLSEYVFVLLFTVMKKKRPWSAKNAMLGLIAGYVVSYNIIQLIG